MDMSGPESPVNGYLACGVCRQSVSVSEARSAEASDYVVHFCGLDCYHRWLSSSHTFGDDTF